MARSIKYVVVHHNGVAGRTIEDVRRTHVEQNGWKAIGYHYVIHEDGTIHTGRPESRAGAHVEGLNASSIGICLIGDGNASDFNAAQYDTLVTLLRLLMTRYKLLARAVIGHRETKTLVKPALATKKLCPGTKVDLDALRARLTAPELVA